MALNLEMVKREVIKPASPPSSHDHLRSNIQLSFFDLSCPSTYVPIIFFYNGNAIYEEELFGVFLVLVESTI